ncbi:MAG: c-type cytochrome [Geminicoccaceae bacterium]
MLMLAAADTIDRNIQAGLLAMVSCQLGRSGRVWGESSMARLLLACLLGAAVSGAHAQPAPDPANGQALAGKLCVTCHLIDPTARGPVPDGVPSFMAIAARPGIDAERLRASLLRPAHPAMPSPPLDTSQMRDVAAYILSLRP